MTPPRFVGFAGSWGLPSKTRALVTEATTQAAARFGGQADVFDILDLGAGFGSERRLSDLAPSARAHLDALVAADAIVIGSPVYKGSYSGLFKHVIDLLDPMDLVGKPVLLMAAGGGDRHALMIEHQLRPLFGFFEARVLATGVYASSADFTDGKPSAVPLLTRLERAVGQFAPYLPGQPGAV